MAIDKTNVKRKAQELGAKFVGIASVDRWDGAPETVRPESVVPGAKTVIIIGVPIPRGIVETIPSHLWAREHGHLMGTKVDEITTELALWIEEQGFKASPVGGLSIPKDTHKAFSEALKGTPYPIYNFLKEGGIALNRAGYLAGIGTLGKSGNLVVEEFGPNVILGGVVTTAQIEPDSVLEYEICDDCNKCVEACPAGAISKEGKPGKPIFDPIKCWLMNAMEGRTLKTAIERGDNNIAEFLQKTIFMQTEATPATCVCGAGCLVSCPIDKRAKKLK